MKRVGPRVVLIFALVASALVIGGCDRKPARVTSLWPFAAAERTIPAPPAPVRWPYTGRSASDAAAPSRRPLSVKIENSPAARPQIGLNSADVVYETIAEGGITRFNCTFHSHVPETLGPVRSARLSDLWIVPQYGGLFFFSGCSDSVMRAINAAHLSNLSQDVGVSYPYWRSGERNAPHNLMLDTKKAYVEAKRRGYEVTSTVKSLEFERRAITVPQPTSRVDIPFSMANKVRWEYDAETGKYLRWNNGAVHRDARSGKQVNADNVVVIWAKYTPITHDRVGSVTYDIKLGGSGRATVFRGGGRIDCEWKAGRDAPPHFVDDQGAPVKLGVGRTWFQVVPLDVKIVFE